jgi:hypothetical protein
VTGRHAHRYIRAYLAGIALPTLVVCAAGLLIVGFFDRFDISVQRALILPLATNPLIWGVWNVAWVALSPQRRALIGWYGVLLAVLLIGVGLLVARRLDVSGLLVARLACPASRRETAPLLSFHSELLITFSGAMESRS